MGVNGFIMEVSVSNKEINKAVSSISKYDAKTHLAVEGIIKESSEEIVRKGKGRIRNRTRNLSKSGKATYNQRNMTAFARFTAPHAHLAEFGAASTVVKPQKKKALKYGDKYFTKAKIPKREARPFLFPSHQEEIPNTLRKIKEAMKKT